VRTKTKAFKPIVVFLYVILLIAPSLADRVKQLDELSALWTFYKFNFIENGRVISHDEKGVTTSEGQSYAMLRAVWASDHEMFDTVWNWTKKNLRRKNDKLFAWKYNNGKVLDYNAATDADVDIALALLLGSRLFKDELYADEARKILRDIWKYEVVKVDEKYYLTGGNWASSERYPTIHVAYLAPYAYETFATVDPDHPWKQLVETSYEILHWVYDDQELQLPPEIIYIDKKTGTLLLQRPGSKDGPRFSYDAFPIFWRVAVDYRWYGRSEEKLRKEMLRFFITEWKRNNAFYDTYQLDGTATSEFEGLPLYATVQALATFVNEPFANILRSEKLDPLWKKTLKGSPTPYYFHNWLWFGKAFELKNIRNFNEFMDFLSPIEFRDMSNRFPWVMCIAAILFYIVSRLKSAPFKKLAKAGFLISGGIICVRYLIFRLFTLNFLEPAGPFISITLLIAEIYCFSTLIFLFVQTGFNPEYRRKKPHAPDYLPSVDIYIPIYSEDPSILEKTVLAAKNMNYPNKTIHVCDDSHRQDVVDLAARLGVIYVKGPKKHAKAGNINNAISKSCGDLLLIFDTDHIPVKTFLDETVPFFSDEKVGMLQTPHHFYNADLFQRAFSSEHCVPDEADQFNHGVQGARDGWGGSFFVGSGAIFRRTAIEQIGGIQLLSITEDIHTSQHLHARGWKSVFVNKDLLGGLTAENLSSFIVQRRRWMLGCLQIFFKDNPLKMKGLPWRHRLGYFASLYYFLYPLPKVVFWATPLLYLLFHLHPLFSDVAILMAYLIPYMIVLPMINSSLLPTWPRMLWGQAYENLIFFQMFRSMFDLLLPKKLGFKVTPKGIKSTKRQFDFKSVQLPLFAFGISLFAIGKGLFEFNYFGIERDAYFFNMGWALYNLFLLGSALLVAWERPQRRETDRVNRAFPCRIISEEGILEMQSVDFSIRGAAFKVSDKKLCPRYAVIDINRDIRVGARMVYYEKCGKNQARCAYRFEGVDATLEEKLFLMIFSDPATWELSHDKRPQRSVEMAFFYFLGVIKCFFPQRQSRRLELRVPGFKKGSIKSKDYGYDIWFLDKSKSGCGILMILNEPPSEKEFTVITDNGEEKMNVVYVKQLLPGTGFWRAGLVKQVEQNITEFNTGIAATMLVNS
jgi:cellulose synthase (UDP-forming)